MTKKTRLSPPDIPPQPAAPDSAARLIPTWEGDGKIALDAAKLTKLSVAVWRTNRRAQRGENTPEAVKIACESALDCLTDLEIRLDDLIGQVYHDNLRVNVLEQLGTDDLRITECVSPAVYIRGEMIQPAAVIVMGVDAESAS